ncbi:DUF1996 domain-containing protein [Nonomuraea pusilla]|uniref:DUF1996 domain-containing protein n=1 Tax=Nonomuraea pusilla TaxID=46177 RepID=A0A1H8B6D5_9ACTN|nr:DUF1996 domain-containing protein [Nonomuraea pusilla]SEM78515.1 protein of unknown function [Nonomuraea pusilla]
MRSRRVTAAVSALAVAAGGLVSAAVIGVVPARADHCDPSESHGRQTSPTQGANGRNGDQQDGSRQDGNGRDGNRQAPDGRSPGQEDADRFGPTDQRDRDGWNGDQNGRQDGSRLGRDDDTRFGRQDDTGLGRQDGTRSDRQNDTGLDRQDATRGDRQDDAQTGRQNSGQNSERNGGQGDRGDGGAAVLDPGASPEPTRSADPFGRRGGSGTRTATPAPPRDSTQIPPQNPGQDPGQDGGQDRGGDPRQDPTGLPTEPPTEGPAQEPTQPPGGGQSPSPAPSPTASGQECADLGPFPQDFVDIRQIPPGRLDLPAGRSGSRGTFVSQCGTNRNGHNNPDNFIVAPGVSNGAHHLHDYVGNLSTDAFSTDESLAAAGTTCRLSDKSTYFWPVIRDRRVDANTGDTDGNVGRPLRANAVVLQFRGNPVSKVSAMPRFLRLITGDAKAATNGGGNANAKWSCTRFTNRITSNKYPLCPRGSQVLRILDFPSCWDGQNTDSANHRTHVVFPGEGGACPQGTRAIPQLRMILAYTVPQGRSFALDAFPEQKHNPVTDHGDFANVMPDRLMSFVVSCINQGRRC